MDALGEELLAGSAFSLDKDRCVVGGHRLRRSLEGFHFCIRRQDIVEMMHCRQPRFGEFITDILFHFLQLRDIADAQDVPGLLIDGKG